MNHALHLLRRGLPLLLALAFLLFAAPVGAAPSLLTNGDFEAGDTGFTTDLFFWPYTRAANPSQGDMGERRYVVRGDCHDVHNSWGSFYDHTTGDASGKYLVVNASGALATNLVWRQTVTVAPNTLYRFSFWLANIYPINPAAIQLQVEGVDVGAAMANSVGYPAWQQFSVNFSSGATTTITLSLRDLTAQPQGDDFGLDDLALVAVGPLPVVLSSFGAQARPAAPATVDVRWTTASEVNSAYFEVQRAVGGSANLPANLNWVALGRVAAQGTSTTPRAYAYADATGPPDQVRYYRLRLVEADGRAAYSAVAVVAAAPGSAASPGALSLWPNPTAGDAWLRLPPGATARAHDARGREVWQATAPAVGVAAELPVPAAGWAAGVYVVRVQAPGAAPQTLRLVR